MKIFKLLGLSCVALPLAAFDDGLQREPDFRPINRGRFLQRIYDEDQLPAPISYETSAAHQYQVSQKAAGLNKQIKN